MRPTVEELKRCGLSKKVVSALERRHLGGAAGSRGYAFQRRYALLRLCECALEDSHASITVEAPLCPVDDVVVEGLRGHEHAQCKTSPRISWTADRRKLIGEFRAQFRLLQRSTVRDYRLVLVVSHPDSAATLAASRPRGLGVEVVHLEDAAKPWLSGPISRALDALLPPLLRQPSHREHLYMVLNHHAGDPWEVSSVAVLLAACLDADHRMPLATPPALRRPWSVDAHGWAAARAILSKVPGLEILIDGDVCTYRLPRMQGLIARCDSEQFHRFVEDVLAEAPMDVRSFHKVLPR